MPSVKYQFHVAVDGKEKENYVVIRRVRSCADETWFSFPEELQRLSHHEDLVKLPSLKSALNVLKIRGQYRTVNVTLDEAVQKLYIDEDGNFIFKNHLLAETKFLTSPTMQNQNPSESKMDELVSCLSKPREETVKDIMKHFLIEKFSPKNRNVEAWCDLFEKESARFKLIGQKQIEVLKSCLDPSMNDWFAVNQRRLASEAHWSDWKLKLISTFGDNSWKPIRYAYTFKFLNGSLIDYAIKKEKMLLELDRDIPDLLILDLIVVGLPLHIQNTLNRHSVNSIEKLHNKLKKYDGEEKNFEFSNKSKFVKNYSNSNRNVNNSNKMSEDKPKNKNAGTINFVEKRNSGGSPKKPCSICIAKGFPDRFHPESACWFKDKPISTQTFRSVNNIEAESSSPSSDEEPKN